MAVTRLESFFSEVGSLDLTRWPDLRWPWPKIFRKVAEHLTEQLCKKTSGGCSPPPPPSWARINFWMRGLLSSGIAPCQRYCHVPFLRLCHQAANQGKMSFSSYDVGGSASGGGASQRWPTRTASGHTQGRCFRSDRQGLFIQVRRAGAGAG